MNRATLVDSCNPFVFYIKSILFDVVADYEPLRKRIENEKIRNSDVDDEKKE